MKAKTIKQVLRKQVDAWLESIEDEAVRDLAAKNVIVTGGAIASMLLREPVNDFDIYFRTKPALRAVAQYYISRFKPKSANGIECAIYLDEKPHLDGSERVRVVVKSAGVYSEAGTPYQYFESAAEGEAGKYAAEVVQGAGNVADKYEELEEQMQAGTEDSGPKYRPVFVSTNAITLSNRIQIVLRFFGEPAEIHRNYDFVHCTNYWTSWDDALTLHPAALECLLSRELRYVGSKYPICSIIRLRKFIKRGWSINAGQVLKMCFQISELDLKNFEVLQDQLTGVDMAYFSEVMHKLKDRDPEKVNGAYLIEIIERMF